jgi:hypothetical protein
MVGAGTRTVAPLLRQPILGSSSQLAVEKRKPERPANKRPGAVSRPGAVRQFQFLE